MAELDRTYTKELFTEVLESTPCIIVYSQQAFEYSKNYLRSTTQTAKEIFEGILGVHECKIVYKGKDKKDFRKYQFIIEELKLSIYATAKQNLTEFSLSYIYGRKNEKCKTLCNGKRCYFQWVAGRFEGDFWHSENVILVGFAWILLGFSRLKV